MEVDCVMINVIYWYNSYLLSISLDANQIYFGCDCFLIFKY